MQSVTLSNFEILYPAHRLEQRQAEAFLLARHEESAGLGPEGADLAKLFRRYAVKPDLIETRYSECPDVAATPVEEGERIYRVSAAQPSGSDLGRRTKFFAACAEQRLREFYPGARGDLSHLIHVTCSGYRSPSAAQKLIAERGWGREVGVTHAYHMGCYASLPAIRLAEALAIRKGARVDIVHNELCGLHLNPADHSPEQIVVQTLFADGHVKYSVTPTREGQPGLEVQTIKEEIVEDSAHAMSWAPEAWGFAMTLSRDVPARIGSVIARFFAEMAEEAGVPAAALLDRAIFAVHPGGPKIIQTVQEALGLRPEQIAASQEILRERGNMSSATLPHVWERILSRRPSLGTPVVSFAFGPGLTVFGAVFRVT